MESTLHRELKTLYAGAAAQCEVRLGTYRIDAVLDDGCLVEIQHGSLAAIRRKVESLLADDLPLLLVKPIIARKRIIWLKRRGGAELRRRWSPKRCGFVELFHELVFVAKIFPHPRLTIEVPLVEVEEVRVAARDVQQRRRRFPKPYRIVEQRLGRVVETRRFRENSDLVHLLPNDLPQPFHTGHLAEQLGIARWLAQRVAYCLRMTNAARVLGKQGNAWLYELTERPAAA